MKLTDVNVAKVLLALHDNCEARVTYIDDYSIRKAAEVCEILAMLDGDGETVDPSTANDYLQSLRWGFKALCELIITLYKNNNEEE